MIVGVPTEVKTREYRVGMTPAGVRSLTSRGHKVLVEKGAGEGAASRTPTTSPPAPRSSPPPPRRGRAEMVVKVKEPLPAEYGFFREDLILYTYLHLAPEPELTKELVEAKVTGIAYETIELDDGSLPLLRPMSEVAGRMAVQVGASSSRRSTAARACSSAACPARVAAASSSSAAASSAATRRRIAVGMGAQVTILDVNVDDDGVPRRHLRRRASRRSTRTRSTSRRP